jgi:hypothetical protein
VIWYIRTFYYHYWCHKGGYLGILGNAREVLGNAREVLEFLGKYKVVKVFRNS